MLYYLPMATAAEAGYAASLAALRTERSFAVAAPASGKVKKAVRRRMVVWISHAIITLGAPESLGITLFVGFLFDMFRVVLTLVGPAVGLRGGWTQLFTIQFWEGDLLDKADALWVLVECFAAIIALLFLIILFALAAQTIANNPLANLLPTFL